MRIVDFEALYKHIHPRLARGILIRAAFVMLASTALGTSPQSILPLT